MQKRARQLPSSVFVTRDLCVELTGAVDVRRAEGCGSACPAEAPADGQCTERGVRLRGEPSRLWHQPADGDLVGKWRDAQIFAL